MILAKLKITTAKNNTKNQNNHAKKLITYEKIKADKTEACFRTWYAIQPGNDQAYSKALAYGWMYIIELLLEVCYNIYWMNVEFYWCWKERRQTVVESPWNFCQHRLRCYTDAQMKCSRVPQKRQIEITATVSTEASPTLHCNWISTFNSANIQDRRCHSEECTSFIREIYMSTTTAVEHYPYEEIVSTRWTFDTKPSFGLLQHFHIYKHSQPPLLHTSITWT